MNIQFKGDCMTRKFKSGETVTILGTDNAVAFVSQCQPSNSKDYVVCVDNPEEVYPYHGGWRTYPEHMLEKVNV